LPLRPAFFAFKACLQGLPSLPSRHALLPFHLAETNKVTIAHHVVCTCQCTLQYHTGIWSFDACHVVMPC